MSTATSNFDSSEIGWVVKAMDVQGCWAVLSRFCCSEKQGETCDLLIFSMFQFFLWS